MFGEGQNTGLIFLLAPCSHQVLKGTREELKELVIEGTEGKAIPRTFLFLIFKKFFVTSVVKV
jgi:hypothetical protein